MKTAPTLHLVIGIFLYCTLTLQAETVLDFAWSGGVTDSSVTIIAGVKAHQKNKNKQSVQFALYKDQAMKQRVAESSSSTKGIAKKSFSKLQADTRYYFSVGVNGVLETELNDQNNGKYAYTGTFQTFPVAGKPASFNFIHTCSTKAGSEGDPVFETIKNQNPLFFMHTGDFFYADQGGNSYTNEAGFRNCYDKNLNCFNGVDAASQASLYRNTPLVYMWDDHDFGKNDCVGEVPPGKHSKPHAHAVYREYVPHYPLTGRKENPIYQAFSVGRVRFILTDLRTAAEKPGRDQQSTRLGRKQKRWFKKELRKANGKFPLIVWVTTIPWNGEAKPGQDRWQSYAEERTEIANFIKENRIKGLCAISGDMHATAIDDGSNTDFADEGGAGFPIFHSGPLGSHTSIKAGPYNKGASAAPRQFGLVEINDNGKTIRVTWSGRDENNQILKSTATGKGYPEPGTLLHYSFEVPAQ